MREDKLASIIFCPIGSRIKHHDTAQNYRIRGRSPGTHRKRYRRQEFNFIGHGIYRIEF